MLLLLEKILMDTINDMNSSQKYSIHTEKLTDCKREKSKKYKINGIQRKVYNCVTFPHQNHNNIHNASFQLATCIDNKLLFSLKNSFHLGFLSITCLPTHFKLYRQICSYNEYRNSILFFFFHVKNRI